MLYLFIMNLGIVSLPFSQNIVPEPQAEGAKHYSTAKLLLIATCVEMLGLS